MRKIFCSLKPSGSAFGRRHRGAAVNRRGLLSEHRLYVFRQPHSMSLSLSDQACFHFCRQFDSYGHKGFFPHYSRISARLSTTLDFPPFITAHY